MTHSLTNGLWQWTSDQPDDDLETALDRVWAGGRPTVPDRNVAIIEKLESQYEITLPEDFAAYLRSAAHPHDYWDDRGFIWWAPENVKSLRDDCGPALPSSRPLPEVAEETDKYLIFADFMAWCWAYAICCSDGPNRGKVALIAGEPDRFVAGSFRHFVNLAAVDSAQLYPPRGEQDPDLI